MRSIQVFGKKVTGWQVLPADAKDFEEAALRACELVLVGDPRIRKVPGARRVSRSGAKQVASSPKRAELPKVSGTHVRSPDEFEKRLRLSLARAPRENETAVVLISFGDSRRSGKEPLSIPVDASIGLAEWHQKETMEEVLEQAYGSMYRNKKDSRK